MYSLYPVHVDTPHEARMRELKRELAQKLEPLGIAHNTGIAAGWTHLRAYISSRPANNLPSNIDGVRVEYIVTPDPGIGH